MPEQSTTRTIEWIGEIDGFVRLIDQTRLPGELVYRECRTVEEVWEAIRSLRVRGAHARERLLNRQIDCRNYAYEEGIDMPEVTEWRWPL